MYPNNDRFAAQNGITFESFGSPDAVCHMTVTEQHLNEVGIPHGGIYFAIADAVFGAACDYAHVNIVTLSASIDFLASAQLGDTLTATSKEISATRKIVTHDIEVRNQNDELMAIARIKGYLK